MWRMLVHTRWRSYASIVASRPVVPPVLVNWPGFRRAGLLRNSTCSPFPGPRRRGDTDRQPTTLVFGLFVRPGPFANATVHSGSSRPGLSIASQSATQSYVNRQVSSSALTATFISRNRQLKRTVAPASRKTRARVLPGPAALLRNRPECGQAALCHPLLSTRSPHSHLPSVTAKGNLNLSRIKVRNSAASTVNSGLVGHPWSTLEDPPPE